MFDSQQSAELKAIIPEFSWEAPCNSTIPLPLSMQLYLEVYGFFDTLKSIELDYFWGFRSVSMSGESYRVATHFWQLPNPKGTIFLVHGLFDHVGLFQNLIRYFLLQGYSVIAVDLPGHGLSDGERTKVEVFSDYAGVVEQTLAFFKHQISGGPVYGVGQSTGAAVLMSMVFELERRSEVALFERLVFLGPLVRQRGATISRLIYKIFGRFIRQIRRDFSTPNSHDSEFHNFLQYHDPLQPKFLSIEWIGALYHWMDDFSEKPKVATPVLIVQGTADRVVDWRFNVTAIQANFSCSQVHYIKGAMHHLANEADPWRKAVFSGIGQFFRQRAVCALPQSNKISSPSL